MKVIHKTNGSSSPEPRLIFSFDVAVMNYMSIKHFHNYAVFSHLQCALVTMKCLPKYEKYLKGQHVILSVLLKMYITRY